MAQQTTAADDAQTENDPELAAATEAEAVDSLQVHMTRSEMRDAAREWGTRSSGTKQEMAEAMLADAADAALGFLAEEGVALQGDLADDEAGAEQPAEDTETDDGGEQEAEQADAEDGDLIDADEVPGEAMDEVAREYGMGAGAVKGALQFQPPASDADCTSEADEAALEARRRATPGYEAEADEAGTSQPQGSLAGDLLARSPEDYGYTAKLQMTEKQTAAVVAALADPDATQAEVAEAADCTERYANSTLNRWRGTADEVAAAEDAGASVPAEYEAHEVTA